MKRCEPNEQTGFTLTELVVAAAIIAVGSAIALDISGREIRRERINSVAVGLNGWLEEVRRSALKGNPCSITISATSSAAQGTPIATAAAVASASGAPTPSDACQSKTPSYRLPKELGSSKVAINSTLQFTFGTLGTVTPTSPTEKQVILTLIQPNGQADKSRCLRIRGMMGFSEVGNLSGSTCTYPSRY